MYYKDIEISGFRGIKNLKIEDLSRINLFFGKNNCGKTSVLEAFFLLSGFSNPSMVLKINNFRGEQIQEVDDFKAFYYNLEFNKQELKIGSNLFNNGERTLVIKPNYNSVLLVNEENTRLNQNYKGNVSLPDKALNELIFDFTYKEPRKSKITDKVKIFVDNAGQIKIPQYTGKYTESLKGIIITPHTLFGGETTLEKQFEQLVIEKKTKEIIEVLKVIDNRISDIAFGTNKIFVDIGIERLLNLKFIGDGVRRILAVIIAIHYAKNGVVFIDEIENGLHFSSMKTLWKAIIKASKQFNTQLFITTHNIETLKYLKEAIAESEDEKDKDLIKSYTIRKYEDDSMEAYKHNFDNLEYALEQKTEIR